MRYINLTVSKCRLIEIIVVFSVLCYTFLLGQADNNKTGIIS